MSLAAAVRIGRTLTRNALWGEDGQCTWIGPARRERINDPIVYEGLGPDLYGGTTGIAWFLAHLFSATGESEFRRTSLGAIRYSLASTVRIRRAERISFYVGQIGVAFVAVEVARRLGVDEIERQAAASLLEIAKPGADVFHWKTDLIFGSAGALAALPVLSARLNDPRLLEFSVALGERVLRRAERSARGLSWRASRQSRERNLTGFSHGTAGIAHGLLELYAATVDERFRAGAEGAFAYERSWFDEERGNWPDFRGVPKKSRSKDLSCVTYWCHGAAGIALSRIRAWELLRDERYRAEAMAAIRTTRAAVTASLESGRGGICVCHGLAGNSEVLLEGARLDPSLVRIAARGARQSAKRAALIESPSLFLGLAGIGYLNLRLHDPSLLSLLLIRRERFG